MPETFGQVPIAGSMLTIERSEVPLVVGGITYASEIRGDRLLIAPDVPPHFVVALVASAVSHAWTEAIQGFADTLTAEWDTWAATTDAIDDELSEDDAGDVFAAFNRLRRLGIKFDPTFIQNFDALRPVPSAFDPNDPRKGVRNAQNRAQTSESFVDDDEYEYAGPGHVQGMYDHRCTGDGDADPDGDSGE